METVERPGTLGHQVFAPFGKEAQHLRFGLGIDRRQLLVAPGGQRGGEGIQLSSFLRALPLQSTRTCAESLGGTSTTDSPAAANLPAKCRPRPPAFSTAQRRSGKRFAQRSRALRPARFCGKVARSTGSPVA